MFTVTFPPDDRRTRTGIEGRAEGHLFVKFIALMVRIHIRNILSKHDDDVPRTRKKKDSVNGMPVDKVMLSLCTLMAVGSTGIWSIDTVPFDACLQRPQYIIERKA